MVTKAANPNYDPVRFSLRTVMIAIAVVSIFLGLTQWQYRGLKGAHTSAVRDAYVRGRITIEEAREQIGNVADSWPTDIHERAQAARKQRQY